MTERTQNTQNTQNTQTGEFQTSSSYINPNVYNSNLNNNLNSNPNSNLNSIENYTAYRRRRYLLESYVNQNIDTRRLMMDMLSIISYQDQNLYNLVYDSINTRDSELDNSRISTLNNTRTNTFSNIFSTLFTIPRNNTNTNNTNTNTNNTNNTNTNNTNNTNTNNTNNTNTNNRSTNLSRSNTTFNFTSFNFEDFTRPVPVIPNEEQILNATTIARFNDISNPVNTTCPIRREVFTNDETVMQINYCGHIFTPTLLREWFSSNVRCPLCRYDIRTNQNNNSNIFSSSTTSPRSSSSAVNNDNVSSSSSPNYREDLSNNLREVTYETPTINIRNENIDDALLRVFELITNDISNQNINLNTTNILGIPPNINTTGTANDIIYEYTIDIPIYDASTNINSRGAYSNTSNIYTNNISVNNMFDNSGNFIDETNDLIQRNRYNGDYEEYD